MHESKEMLPLKLEGPGTALRAIHDWGNMSVAYIELPAGTDLGPLLAGLADDVCHCPHWGYIIKGSLHIRYTDTTEEIIKAGDVFYLPAGHTGWLDEDTAFVEFSPNKEFIEVLEHVMNKAN